MLSRNGKEAAEPVKKINWKLAIEFLGGATVSGVYGNFYITSLRKDFLQSKKTDPEMNI